MNTYFNEITSKPINTVDGKILYKIPAGAMAGNGDVGVVTNVNSDFPLRPEVSSVIEGKIYRLWEDSDKNNITVLGDLRKFQKGVL